MKHKINVYHGECLSVYTEQVIQTVWTPTNHSTELHSHKLFAAQTLSQNRAFFSQIKLCVTLQHALYLKYHPAMSLFYQGLHLYLSS